MDDRDDEADGAGGVIEVTNNDGHSLGYRVLAWALQRCCSPARLWRSSGSGYPVRLDVNRRMRGGLTRYWQQRIGTPEIVSVAAVPMRACSHRNRCNGLLRLHAGPRRQCACCWIRSTAAQAVPLILKPTDCGLTALGCAKLVGMLSQRPYCVIRVVRNEANWRYVPRERLQELSGSRGEF